MPAWYRSLSSNVFDIESCCITGSGAGPGKKSGYWIAGECGAVEIRSEEAEKFTFANRKNACTAKVEVRRTGIEANRGYVGPWMRIDPEYVLDREKVGR